MRQTPTRTFSVASRLHGASCREITCPMRASASCQEGFGRPALGLVAAWLSCRCLVHDAGVRYNGGNVQPQVGGQQLPARAVRDARQKPGALHAAGLRFLHRLLVSRLTRCTPISYQCKVLQDFVGAVLLDHCRDTYTALLPAWSPGSPRASRPTSLHARPKAVISDDCHVRGHWCRFRQSSQSTRQRQPVARRCQSRQHAAWTAPCWLLALSPTS